VRVLWWGSACWSVVLICLDASDRAQQELILNSDQLYIPALMPVDVFGQERFGPH
jgi:hypothetical protein